MLTTRPGDFGFRPLVDAIAPTMSDLDPWTARLGLDLQAVYLYGGLVDGDGTGYVLERKFMGAMTGGLYAMRREGDEIAILPETVRTSRGETKRSVDASGALRFRDQLMAKLGGLLGDDEQPLDLRIDDDGIAWTEGQLLQVDGGRIGPGLHLYAPVPDESLLYLSLPYEVRGTIRGTPVEGIVLLDYGYWPAGRDWKEFRYFHDVQIGWAVFANRFTDGSVEWGHLCAGRGGFTWGTVFDEAGLVASGTTDTVDVEVALDDADYVARATFGLGAGTWNVTTDPRGRMGQFSRSRQGEQSYRAQTGITRRDGDDRELAFGFTWMEAFADRIRDAGLVTEATV